MTLREYYGEAFPRAFWTAVYWALGQGWALSFFLALAGVVCAILWASRGLHTWQAVKNRAWSAVSDFVIVFLSATILVLIGLFVWFFINDAPEQLSTAKQDAANKVAEANKQTTRLQEQVNMLRTQLVSRDAKGLFVECHFSPLPSHIPPTGRYYVVDVFNPDQPAVMAEYFGPPNSDMPPIGHSGGLQCIMTNYTDEALFSVEPAAIMGYIRAVKMANGTSQGGVTAYQSKNVMGIIPKIGFGPDKAFALWFNNNSADFINVRFSSSTTAQHINDTKQVVVPISFALSHTTLGPKISDK